MPCACVHLIPCFPVEGHIYLFFKSVYKVGGDKVNIAFFFLLIQGPWKENGHVLKPETTKRNHQNETSETSETAETTETAETSEMEQNH